MMEIAILCRLVELGGAMKKRERSAPSSVFVENQRGPTNAYRLLVRHEYRISFSFLRLACTKLKNLMSREGLDIFFCIS